MNRTLLIISLCLISYTFQAQHCNVEGAWEVISLRFTDNDGKVTDIDIGDPPGLKILSKTHWAFVELTGEENNPTSGGGGTYRVEGNKYIEFVQYHAATDYIGKIIPFECRVVGDKWYQKGLLPGGTMLEEVYRRAK